jgi:hypothetical protein
MTHVTCLALCRKNQEDIHVNLAHSFAIGFVNSVAENARVFAYRTKLWFFTIRVRKIYGKVMSVSTEMLLIAFVAHGLYPFVA